MPRKRNQQTVDSVLNASWQLFCEKGYEDASYADIAKLSGINRATVQHYFPKKELMASMNLERLRTVCEDLVENKWPDISDPLALQYLTGQIYVAAMLINDGVCKLTRGILESRTFTNSTIASDLNWSIDQVLGKADRQTDDTLRQDVIAGMEGLYGLMFHYTITGERFDVAERLKPGLTSLGRLAGKSAKECEEIFKANALSYDQRVELGREAYDLAFVK